MANMAKDDIRKRYTFEKPIGEGGFGAVKIAHLKKDSTKKYAIKSIKRAEFRSASEMRIVLQMDHPNIAKIYKIMYDDKYIHFVMRLIEGITLEDYMKKFPPLNRVPELHAQIILRQINNAVRYMHNMGITHRDLKLANIMVCNHDTDDPKNLRILVIDFGLSIYFKN